ncbi:hypothetical protein LCGC14_2520960, partial [marine sediment metagenome]
RQARLRDTTRRLTGEVLEFNELLSENLQRFRELERRPSTIVEPRQVGGRLFDVPTGIEPTRFQPSPSPSGRFVDRLEEPVQEQRVNPFRVELDRAYLAGTPPEGLTGRVSPEELQRATILQIAGQFVRGERGEQPIPLELAIQRAVEEVQGVAERGAARAADIGRVESFAKGPLGTGPLGATATTSLLPERAREAIGSVPVVGPALEREVTALSTPLGLGAAAIFPGAVAAGAVGGVAAATGAQELGAGETGQLIAQIAGNVLAPGGGIVPAAAVTRPAAAAARTGRELVGEAAERARLAPEVGGGPLRGGVFEEGSLNFARQEWWDNLSTAQRKAAVERTLGGEGRFIPKKDDRSYRALLRSGRVRVADDAFKREFGPAFRPRQPEPKPLTPEEVAFGPQETAISTRTPGELQELDQFGRPRFAGEETAHIAKGDPGPPQEPPTGGGPPAGPLSPDGPEFDDILDAAIKGEKPDQALMRRHQGVIDARAS